MEYDPRNDWPRPPRDSGVRLGSIVALIIFIALAITFMAVISAPCPWLGQLCNQ